MALTFPSSPTNGQYYTDATTGNRYVYNSASGVWTFAANNVGMSISSTPPANVASGALWYNREIGRTFVYYDDGDSKQWVETVPATGFFDSSTVAGYANAATQIYLTPVYNTANAAYSKANAALPNVSNAVFDGNLRVTGVLSIGSNTITITDKHIVANDYYRMNTSGHMVAVVDGNKVNVIYTVANAAFDSANNVAPQVTPAFQTANAAYAAANSAYAFTWNTTVRTSAFTASSNTGYFVNTTSGSVVVNLPASPVAGARVTIVDYAGTSETNNIVLNLNGNKLNSITANGTINNNRAAFELIYIDSTQGWVNYSSYIQTTPGQTYTIEYLIVAGGGGGGGYYAGGGGGAGGYIASSASVLPGTSYSATIGAGGTAGPQQGYGGAGGNSSLGSLGTAIGGGYGAYAITGVSGGSGGSGGGGGAATSGVTYAGGAGTAGQGNAGGYSLHISGAHVSGGGGGGYGAAGGNASNTGTGQGGDGGVGGNWQSLGTYYAGGGGGGLHYAGTRGGYGGSGGGGAGGTLNQSGSNATTNTGGGGGGGGNAGYQGGAGGSGIVIIRYLGAQRGSGGTVTSAGGYTYHTFTTSGTFIS